MDIDRVQQGPILDADPDHARRGTRAAHKQAGEAGMSRTDLRDLFGRNLPARRIQRALAGLLEAGRIVVERQETDGRPRETSRLAPPFGR